MVQAKRDGLRVKVKLNAVRDILEGISGYVAQDGARARLLIGPFKSSSDARMKTPPIQ